MSFVNRVVSETIVRNVIGQDSETRALSLTLTDNGSRRLPKPGLRRGRALVQIAVSRYMTVE